MESKASFPEERRFGKRLEERMRDNGLLLRCDPNWIAFAPPLIMTIPQADEMVDIFAASLQEELKMPR
jgi:4-aminobutyrate--pyruvate transaminase